MFRKHLIAVPFLAVAALAACSTVEVGQDFDLHTFASEVERGVTTEAQVRGWLGAPASTGVSVDPNGDHYDEWTYYYGKGQLPNMSGARIKTLQIKFDPKGIVRAYDWSGDRR